MEERKASEWAAAEERAVQILTDATARLRKLEPESAIDRGSWRSRGPGETRKPNAWARTFREKSPGSLLFLVVEAALKSIL